MAWCQILSVGIFSSLSHLIRFSSINYIHFVLVCVFVATLGPADMDKQLNTPFQSCHAVEFFLRICERSAGANPVVVMAVCQFCEVFGK